MSDASAARSRHSILVFSAVAKAEDPLLAGMRQGGEVRLVTSAEEALSALSTGLYDVVVATPTELFPLARAEARQRAELILEKIGQAVCIVDRQGTLVWGNAKLRSYPEPVVDVLRANCAALGQEIALSQTTGAATNPRRTIRMGQDYVFDLTVSPLLAANQQVEEVVGLVHDVTGTHRLQDKINIIDAAGRDLVRLDAEALGQLDVLDRLKLLEDKSIQYARDLMHFDHFAIRVLDKKTNRLETLIASGFPEEARSLIIYASPEGNGISGYVAATGRSYICPDVRKDPRFLPGLESAGSSLTVPLMLHDQVVGVMDVESHETSAFNEDDRQFAEMFGRYLAIGLNILKLLAVERSTTTGQIATDVSSELAVPLNDIIAQATATIQAYPDQGELRRRLDTIIADVDRVKRSVQAMTESPGIRGLIPEFSSKDPLLDGKRILIAEDEDIIRETIADVLTKYGALTVMAGDGQEAVNMIGAQHFDLVLSDIKMPFHNGYEIFAAAKQVNERCPVVLITGFGYDPDHSIVRASKEGLAGVLFKPFKVEQLIEALHHALRSAEGT